jgi:ABC-type transport system involved in multi-copper enzyme maturation permease subunit
MIPHKINMHKLLWIILTLVLTFIVVVGVALLVTIGPKPTYSGNVTDTSGD